MKITACISVLVSTGIVLVSNFLLVLEVLRSKKKVFISQTDREMRMRIRKEIKTAFSNLFGQTVWFVLTFITKIVITTVVFETQSQYSLMISDIFYVSIQVPLCINFFRLLVQNKPFYDELKAILLNFGRNLNK